MDTISNNRRARAMIPGRRRPGCCCNGSGLCSFPDRSTLRQSLLQRIVAQWFSTQSRGLSTFERVRWISRDGSGQNLRFCIGRGRLQGRTGGPGYRWGNTALTAAKPFNPSLPGKNKKGLSCHTTLPTPPIRVSGASPSKWGSNPRIIFPTITD